ncbi:MAG TPA: class I SAM-dependent methyltransferase [Candidatus Binatia bacterium]|nr:class I SAM-dependent methyltransferase [Candidatus Binatia bacterium]
MPAQKSAFLDGEADAYFSRNTSALAANAGLVSFYAEYVRANMRVLEIGCASGANVAAICREKQCQGFGVDPSPLAVGSGKQAYPNISLAVGTADKLNFADAAFDMVLFGFCLYLVDRALLMKVAAESDRVLKDGGFLGLWDFDPIVPTKRHYHHRPGLWSYKMDYSKLFLSNPAYKLIAKKPFSHSGHSFVHDPQERLAAWLMHKSESLAYKEE